MGTSQFGLGQMYDGLKNIVTNNISLLNNEVQLGHLWWFVLTTVVFLYHTVCTSEDEHAKVQCSIKLASTVQKVDNYCQT